MPRSKNPEHYPRQFVTVSEECAIRGRVFELHFKSRGEALRMQQTFIAFVGAMRRIQERLNVQGKEPSTEYDLKWLATLAHANRTQPWVKVNQEDGSATLTFRNREDSEIGRMLDVALGEGKVGGSTSQAQEADIFFAKVIEDLEKEGLGVVGEDEKLPPEIEDRLASYGARRGGKDGE